MDLASPSLAFEGLVQTLRQRLGAEHVQVGDDDGMDLHVWPDAVPPLCVVQPSDAAEISEVVRLAVAAGASVVPRGTGLSYTGGTVCAGPHVTLDTGRLGRVEIHADDMYVVVGAGCTWAALAAALHPHRLRVPITAPVSGNVSTIGGGVSQNLPGSMAAVLGLRVVLADGTLLTTGSAAWQGRTPFYRNAGPDLTGLFLGDCGAFGIKTDLVLQLTPTPRVAVASFAFADPVAMVAAIARVQRVEGGAICMALDPVRSAHGMRSIGPAEAARIALAMMRQGRWPMAGLSRRLRRRGRPGQDWTLHVTVEAASAAGAAAQRATLRRHVGAAGGIEIAATVPAALQARPFSVRGAVGPAAERWVPVHGLLPLSAAADAMRALLSYAASVAAECRRYSIDLAWLLSSRPGHILIEPMLLWPEALGTQHRRHLPPRINARAAERPANPDTRAVVDRIRAELRGIMDAHGAVHLQLGRYYDHAAILDPATHALLAAMKHATDPGGRLNPGSLGL